MCINHATTRGGRQGIREKEGTTMSAYISHATTGFLELPEDVQAEAIQEFERQAARKADRFYSLLSGRVFVEQNERRTYTAMLAEEH